MEMKDSELVAEALKDKKRKETLEQALGRAVRKNNGKYEEYLRILADIREIAYARGITPIEAARVIAGQP